MLTDESTETEVRKVGGPTEWFSAIAGLWRISAEPIVVYYSDEYNSEKSTQRISTGTVLGRCTNYENRN
jgi:hypothetical protein